MLRGGAAQVQHFQPRVIIYACRTNDHASSVLSYDQPLEYYDFLLLEIFPLTIRRTSFKSVPHVALNNIYNVCIALMPGHITGRP